MRCKDCVLYSAHGFCTWYGEDVSELSPSCEFFKERYKKNKKKEKPEITKNYPRGC